MPRQETERDLGCFGFVSALRILRVQHYPPPNSGAPVLEVLGGITPDAAIVSVLASRLGLGTRLVCNDVGNDTYGRELVRILTTSGVSSQVAGRSNNPTPMTWVVCDEEQNRTWFSFLPNVIPDLLSCDLDRLKGLRLVYVDLHRVILKASLRVIDWTKSNNVPLFANLGGEAPSSSIRRKLRGTDLRIVQNSVDETGERNAERMAEELRKDLRPQVAIVTSGRWGAICLMSSKSIRVPAYRVKTIHNNGAGAAFSAGFAYAYLHGWPIAKAARFSSALGALYCTVQDGFMRFTVNDILKFSREGKTY